MKLHLINIKYLESKGIKSEKYSITDLFILHYTTRMTAMFRYCMQIRTAFQLLLRSRENFEFLPRVIKSRSDLFS